VDADGGFLAAKLANADGLLMSFGLEASGESASLDDRSIGHNSGQVDVFPEAPHDQQR
jgi:hypothetical protein